MKKNILIIPMILMATIIMSCSKNSRTESENLARKYIEAIEISDFKTMASCFKKDTDKDLENIYDYWATDCSEITDNGGLKKYKINDVEDKGDNAIVRYEIYCNNQRKLEKTMITKKIKGNWYIQY